MNAVFQDKMLILHPRYNVHSLIHLLSYSDIMRVRKPYNYYRKKQIMEAAEKPAIIHLTTSFLTNNRAWYENSNHPMASLYQKYKALSPWRDSPDFKDNRGIMKRVISFFVRNLPKSIVLPVAEYLYNNYRIKKISSLIAKL